MVHCDIKPENFLTGNSESNMEKIFATDFGLTKTYRQINGDHIPMNESTKL